GIAWVIGTPIVALIALARTSSLRDENRRLAAELASLRQQMGQPPAEAAPPAPPVAAVEEAPLPPPFEPETVAAEAAPPAPPWEAPVPQPAAVGWGQRLGARVFIWLGAITLALAAIFLVRYSIEEGWLSPEVRVILAALFGLGLVAAAE